MALTKENIKTYTAKEYPKRRSFHDRDGLYLKVKGPKNAAWVFKFVLHGKGQELALGSFRAFTRDEAREKVRKARQLLFDGINPVAAKKEAKQQMVLAQAKQDAQAVTFEDAANAYFNAHEKKWKNDVHRAQFLSSLRLHAYPIIQKLRVWDGLAALSILIVPIGTLSGGVLKTHTCMCVPTTTVPASLLLREYRGSCAAECSR